MSFQCFSSIMQTSSGQISMKLRGRMHYGSGKNLSNFNADPGIVFHFVKQRRFLERENNSWSLMEKIWLFLGHRYLRCLQLGTDPNKNPNVENLNEVFIRGGGVFALGRGMYSTKCYSTYYFWQWNLPFTLEKLLQPNILYPIYILYIVKYQMIII